MTRTYLFITLLLFSAQAPPAPAPLAEDWVRVAHVDRVIDGDTLELSVDLGFKLHLTDKFRLAEVDTPEVYGVKKGTPSYQKGLAASAFTKQWVAANATAGGDVIIVSGKDTGKYGRWIVTVYPGSGIGPSLNQALLQTGHAKPYK